MFDDVAAVIMIGGRSARFGSDKSLALFHGKPMVDHVYESVSAITKHVFYSGREAPVFAHSTSVFLPDLAPGIGPIAGLESALENRIADWILLVACDLPLVSPVLLKKLVESRRANCQVVVPVTPDGQKHPTCALYHHAVRHAVTDNIANKQYALQSVLKRVQTREIDASPGLLVNVNTQDELMEWQEKSRKMQTKSKIT